MHKTERYGTPYDDAFKTMLEKFPQLIIPIINEQFNKNYALDETVEFLNTEMHENKEQKVLADSVFRICKDFYHVECQSNPDNTIAVRILEYDIFISLKNPERTIDDIYELKLPKSCVLYLRHNSRTKDNMAVNVWYDDNEFFTYNVPIIKVQTFSKEEIFRKNLFMLLPFYIMRYEAEVDELNHNQEKLHILIDEYKDIVNRMGEVFCVENDTEGQHLCVELQAIMKKVSEYFFRNQETAKSQIGGVLMGGTCWKTFEEECVEKGIEQGIEKGIEQGIEALQGLVNDGIISEELAAAKLNMTLDEFREAVRRLK